MKSSPSSSLTGASSMISSSGSSTTILLRVAALLEGRVGDIEAITGKFREYRGVGTMALVDREDGSSCLRALFTVSPMRLNPVTPLVNDF